VEIDENRYASHARPCLPEVSSQCRAVGRYLA
jgi:hypothetical protein